MTFLTTLGVTELCSFKLVLEGKTGKGIPESKCKTGKEMLASELEFDVRDKVDW